MTIRSARTSPLAMPQMNDKPLYIHTSESKKVFSNCSPGEFFRTAAMPMGGVLCDPLPPITFDGGKESRRTVETVSLI
jgi:hypothetical protein